VAVLLVIGLRHLVRHAVAQRVALAGVALVAAALCWRTWETTYAFRYYGERVPHQPIGLPVHGGWHELFRRLSFDRPEFVTPTTIEIALVLMFLALAGAAAAVVLGSRRALSSATLGR
jgi:hypothetical protein